MSLSDIEIEKQNKALRKELTEKCRKAAEQRGEKFKTYIVVCPFLNDDVPKYLAWLEKEEKRSRKVKIMVSGSRNYKHKSQYNSFQLPEREKQLLKDLFDWTERSAKSNYRFGEAA